MINYLALLEDIKTHGKVRDDRTGVGTQSVFGRILRLDLQKGFPLVTTKKMPFKTILNELIWFFKGTDKCDYLDEKKVTIWKEWTDTNTNSVGPMYGVQLRNWDNSGLDQLDNFIAGIKADPHSRRHVMTLWNPKVVPQAGMSPIENVQHGNAALAACHGVVIQAYVEDISVDEFVDSLEVAEMEHLLTRYSDSMYLVPLSENELRVELKSVLPDSDFVIKPRLHLSVYIRSSDAFLGLPFNIAQYALLTHIVAYLTDTKPGDLIVNLGDVHIYSNHQKQVTEQLGRIPYDLPKLQRMKDFNSVDEIDDETYSLIGYIHHDHIAGEVAI